MPAVPQTNYPSLLQVANLVRSIVDDDKRGLTGTPGEGQVLTNNPQLPQSITLQNFMNSAIRDLYRDIRIMGSPTLIKDNYLVLGIPPVNSPMGVGVPNTNIQTQLAFTGFYDGLQWWTISPTVVGSGLFLPSDMILPLEVYSRQTGSELPFREMHQETGPLPSVYQTNELNNWEWRTDGIWMQGSTTSYDLRIRYLAKYADLANLNIDWNTTYIPIMDCEEALADKIAVRLAQRLGGEALADARITAADSLLKLRQQVTRDRQKIDFRFQLFGGQNQSSNPFYGARY